MAMLLGAELAPNGPLVDPECALAHPFNAARIPCERQGRHGAPL